MTTRRLLTDKLLRFALAATAVSLCVACAHDDSLPQVESLPPPMAERIRGLPSLPVQLAQTAPTFQRLFEGIDIALEDRIPLPDVRTEATYRTYVGGDLSTWLGRRARAIEEAETRLATLRAEGVTVDAIVGEVLVAWLYEQTARDVLANDVPATRPERVRAFREAWRSSMQPMLDRARTYYQRCIDDTRTPPIELSAWASVCRDHAASTLPASEPTTAPANEPTTTPTTNQERP